MSETSPLKGRGVVRAEAKELLLAPGKLRRLGEARGSAGKGAPPLKDN